MKRQVLFANGGGIAMRNRGSAFQKWIPENIDGRYDIDNIVWGTDGIVFHLIPDGPHKKRSQRRLQLTWNWDIVLSYRVTEETYREDCWIFEPDEDWTFYASKNSVYLDSFKQSSCLFPDDAIHFTIVGTNLVADILATSYPVIKVEP